MTEILRAFWKEKRPERIAVLVSGILFAVIFWIYEIPVEIAGYAFLLVILWNVIWFTLVFIRYEKRQRILEENQGKIRTEAGGFPEAESRESEMYQELIRQLYEEKKELESSVQIEKQELSDYYSMWVHQIKTPIAALDILLQNTEQFLYEEDIVNSRINKRLEIIQESIPVSDMKMELFKIEQYVEMALNYLRVEDISSDLSFKQYAVDDMVCQVIRKYAKIFISKKIKMDFKPTKACIVTDEKWFIFVLEQIISNALKYIKKGQISIYMKEKSLVIEDLPRIFEKGFTGYNGRENKKSTGIGLYLCKNIMDKLQWNITADSEVGRGTKIYLTKM